MFSPDCGPAYCLLPAGYWNEPETHLFFDKLLARDAYQFHFIDVGASVGEMVMDIAARPGALSVLAFEPQVQCADVVSRSAALNGFRQVSVRPVALSDRSGAAEFCSAGRSPTAAHLAEDTAHSGNTARVLVSTLDEECSVISGNVLMLVDVEGAETKVLAGGADLVRRTLPCIIFEYNDISKKHFGLDEIRKVLGGDYQIFRLRSDGMLDNDFGCTWNCVAVHPRSIWAAKCQSLLIGRGGH
jgi:FkbM family methyltransferase